ncbi:MAG: FtsH protease activity modulator HflK [Syntrophobacteraceae bacterium]
MEWNNPPPRKPQGPDNIQDLEEALKNLRRRIGGPDFNKGPFLVLGVVFFLAFIALSSVYTIEPQETGVIQRFGKLVRTSDPGLHFKIPFGVERVRKVVTGRVLQREYGYRTVQAGVRSRFTEKGYEEESGMLSGDLNVVDLQWTVQYKVQDPVLYLFHVEDVEATLDDISESVVRRIVGNRYSDEVLTVGRASIADFARKEMQDILDQYATGLQIVTVKLQNANPPEAVKAAFNEVNEARQEKERMINDAQQAYNDKIPKAMGEARQVVTQAEGYALDRVNRAKGDAARFLDILNEYQKAPDVTRRRMYLESVSDFLTKVDHVFIMDDSQKNLLPLFDLNQKGAATAPLQSRSGAGAVRTDASAVKDAS